MLFFMKKDFGSFLAGGVVAAVGIAVFAVVRNRVILEQICGLDDEEEEEDDETDTESDRLAGCEEPMVNLQAAEPKNDSEMKQEAEPASEEADSDTDNDAADEAVTNE